MTGKITERRYDYPERTRLVSRKTGETIVVPAWHECYYYWNGKEIAHYSSKDDVLYLRTDYLAKPLTRDYIGRMQRAAIPEMWADLTESLNINEDTRLSEYTNA